MVVWARRRGSASSARVSLALLAVGALTLAGCGEDAQQQAAREAAQAHVRTIAAYDPDGAHCTQSARLGIFKTARTHAFLCAVRRRSGGCDWFRVALPDTARVAVTLYRRDADCVLPG